MPLPRQLLCLHNYVSPLVSAVGFRLLCCSGVNVFNCSHATRESGVCLCESIDSLRVDKHNNMCVTSEFVRFLTGTDLLFHIVSVRLWTASCGTFMVALLSKSERMVHKCEGRPLAFLLSDVVECSRYARDETVSRRGSLDNCTKTASTSAHFRSTT